MAEIYQLLLMVKKKKKNKNNRFHQQIWLVEALTCLRNL